MAKLAKEATTVRRVLESIFRYFDNRNLWSLQHGLAISVLSDTQSGMENSGMNIFSMQLRFDLQTNVKLVNSRTKYAFIAINLNQAC